MNKLTIKNEIGKEESLIKNSSIIEFEIKDKIFRIKFKEEGEIQVFKVCSLPNESIKMHAKSSNVIVLE